MRAKVSERRMLLAAGILALSLFAVVLFIYSDKAIGPEGISWDFIAHYISARAILASGFLPQSSSIPFIESYRAPVLVALLIASSLISGPIAIPLCIAILLILFLYSLFFLARKFSLNPLILFAVVITPYIANFAFLYDGEDVLSLAFIIITLGLLKEKKVAAGATLALAAMSKYTCLIFLPLLLFLDGRRDRADAFAIFAVVTAPWLLASLFLWGNPLYSYYGALTAVGSTMKIYQIQLSAVTGVLEYLLLPAIVALALICLNLIVPALRKSNHSDDGLKPGYKLQAVFLLLAIIGWLIVAPSQYYFVQERYALFIFIGLALIIATFISNSISTTEKSAPHAILQLKVLVPYLLFLCSIAMILLLYLSVVQGNYMGNTNSFAPALQELKSLGLTKCTIVSNSWIYLDFYNISAVSPYYSSKTDKFPIIAFNTTEGFYSIGAPASSLNLSGYKTAFASSGFSVYIPPNYTCVPGVLSSDT